MLKISEVSRDLLDMGVREASLLGHGVLGNEHILLAISREKNTLPTIILKEKGLDSQKIIDIISQKHNEKKTEDGNVTYSDQIKTLFRDSVEISHRLGFSYVGNEHFFLGILNNEHTLAYDILNDAGIDMEDVSNQVLAVKQILDPKIESTLDDEFLFDDMPLFDEEGVYRGDIVHDRETQPLIENTTSLKRYSYDINESIKKGETEIPVLIEDKIQHISQILCRKKKKSPLIVGEVGVGKTSVINGLAYKINSGNITSFLRGKRLIRLNIKTLTNAIIQETESLVKIVRDLDKNPSFIIVIDDFMGGSSQAEDTIRKALLESNIQIIGAVSYQDYKKNLEKDEVIGRYMKVVNVEEPNDEITLDILKHLRVKYQDYHKCLIDDISIKTAIKLSKRYINDRFLPDKAIDVMDDAIALRKINTQEDAENRTAFELEKGDIEYVISRETGIPVEKLDADETEKMLNLAEIISKEVIGQDHAIEKVAKSIQRARVGLKETGKPIGSFIFLGPTGVGKTKLCKVLAKTLFDSEENFIRFDMSEYMEKHNISKMIGSPPGYIGHNDGGQLTEKVKEKPYSVVLFDEIEKAHVNVFDILLQVLDEGHLTDSKGKKVSFKNCVIIMTSNIGSKSAKKSENFGFVNEIDIKSQKERNEKHYISEIKKHFNPEFINRIDDIIVFNKLTRENLYDVVNIMIDDLSSRIREKDMSLKIDSNAIDILIENGYSEEYGARPIGRTIQNMITDEITQKILKKEVSEGDTILIKGRKEKLYFEILH